MGSTEFGDQRQPARLPRPSRRSLRSAGRGRGRSAGVRGRDGSWSITMPGWELRVTSSTAAGSKTSVI